MNSYLQFPFSFNLLTHKTSFCPKSKSKSCPHYGKTRILGIFLLEKGVVVFFPLFSAFGLNTKRYSISLLIQSKCGKIRIRKTPNKYTFHAVFSCLKFWILETYLRLSPVYLMPRKEVIVLFPKAVLCYNFRSVCLHYDDKDIHKL